MSATPGAAEHEFLGRILAAPLDDEPRLAYAAWLRQRGDPRGDFIHAQCVLQSPDPGDDPDGRQRLHERLAELQTAHELAELRELVGATASPAVRHLQLAENGIGARGGLALARSQRLGAVEALDLAHDPLGDDTVCAIVDSPMLAALRTLRL